MKSTRSLIQVAGLTLLTAGSLPASVFVTNPTAPWYPNGSVVSIGTVFDVGSTAVSIRALGLFDKDGDGLEHSETVALFSTDQTLLGSVTLQSGTGPLLRDGTRWANLTTPIALKANTTYVLAWTGHADSQVNVGAAGSITLNPLFTFNGPGYSYSETGIPGLLFPPLDQRSTGLFAFGGNMELVPEPAAGWIVAAGLLGFAAWRRGRSRVND